MKLEQRPYLSQEELYNQEIREKIALLEDFFENANMPLRCVDANGIIIWANQAELSMLGYNREAYIGSPIANYMVEQGCFNEILLLLEQKGQILNYPTALKKADGSIAPVLINSSVYKKNGVFIHTRCFTRDVTISNLEKQRTKDWVNELEQQQQTLAMALDAAQMGTWNYDISSQLFDYSAQCSKILGIGPDVEVNLELIEKLVDPSDLEQIRTQISNTFTTNDRIIAKFRVKLFNDSEVRYLQIQAKSHFNIEGTPERLFGTLTDITIATLATEQSAKLAAIVSSSDDAIISKSLDSIITSWNPSAERMFGYTAEEMIGQSILKLIPPDRYEEEPAIISKLKKGERVDHFETIRVTKDGKLLDLSLTISPVKNQLGEIIGISKIARDITQQKKEQIRKNDFVAMVSHELKTPLTGMLGYIQLLMRKTRDYKDEFITTTLSKTEIQVKKMMGMIHDFLNVSRLEEGRIHLFKEVFEFGPLVEEVTHHIRLISPNHSFTVDVPEGLFIYGDREKIGQVLSNLLNNAVKYSPNNPSISLTCTKLSPNLLVEIKDHGIGISSIDQGKLFERFYRVDHPELSNTSGFGIGLYLVSELLKMHHSQIRVQSELGKGATFSFELALQQPNELS